MVIGSGIINSNIIENSVIVNENEEIKTCQFQFKNFCGYDKNNNKKYSHYLCIAKDKIANIIINNFIKGHKVFIVGKQEQNPLQKQNENVKIITTIEIINIEYMGNNKNDEEDHIDNANSINSIVNNIINNRNANKINQSDMFT